MRGTDSRKGSERMATVSEWCLDERTYASAACGLSLSGRGAIADDRRSAGRATLAYNGHGEIDELWNRPLRMRLITDYLEAIWEEDDSLPVYAKIWFGNGRLGSDRIR